MSIGVSGDPLRTGLLYGSSPRERHRASEPAARLDPIEIRHRASAGRLLTRRSAGGLGIDPAEPKFRQIEFVDKDVDCANRIVLADSVHAWMKGELQPPRLQ